MPASRSTSRPGSRWPPAPSLFIAAHDDPRRPARPFLARRQARSFPASPPIIAAMIRAALALYEATGEHAYLERALAWQAHARPPLRQSRQRRLFPHRRRRRGPGGAAERHHRRRDAEPECAGGAEPDPARRASPAQHAWREQADRLFDGIAAERRRKSVRPSGAAQRARPAPARGRDRRDRAKARAPTRSSPPPASFPSSTASCCARRADALPAAHPAQDEDQGRARKPRPSSASARPARCR